MDKLPIIIFAIFLSGCTTALDSLRGERRTGSVVQPGERLVIYKGSYREENLKICAEPPPDVATSLFSAISVSLSGNAEERIEGKAALESIKNNDIVKLFERSQGIQGLRDGMYRTCEAYINGGIDSRTYGQQMTYMTATLNFLVTIELCGKILEADGLIERESVENAEQVSDQRSKLYESCISNAQEFAQSVLKANSSFIKDSLIE